MWKKYLALGAAVWILSGVSMVSHASETVSSGEPEQIETEVQGQGAETSEIPVMAQAEVSAQSAAGTYATSGEVVPYEGAKYSLRFTVGDNGIVITGISDYKSKSDLGELVIPAEINGVAVTAIGDWAFSGCSGLTGDLIIPEGVTEIGEGAFRSCSGLTGDLSIPEEVTKIGGYAFEDCRGLTGDLSIPEGVTEIGRYTFKGCSGLTGNLSIPEGVRTIGNWAFRYCSGLTGDLSIPEGVTEIGEHAFYGCRGFTGALSIPEGVTRIGEYAFDSCSGLTGDLSIPEGVTEISEGAFRCCSGFTGDLSIPEGVTRIGDWAFSGCSGFTGALSIPEGVRTIGVAAFSNCSGLTGDLSIPEGVRTIGERAFSYCNGFTGTLSIPEGVTTIGEYAFSGCSGFTGDLNIQASVTTIDRGVFEDCSGFTGALSIPEGVRTIGERAFFGCSGLTGDLSIPEGVRTIGVTAFSGCSGFTGDLNIPASVTTIGRSAFSSCSGCTGDLNIQASVTTIDEYAFYGCSGFKGSLNIPEGVTTIGKYAFSGCSGFKGALSIPEGVTEIREGAFEGCSGLTGDLSIPEGVTEISRSAFYNCSGFTGDLSIPEGVTTIDKYAFEGCSGFKGSLNIPEGVTTIGEYAFYGCSGFKGSLIIPEGVTKIGVAAFKGCSGIRDITVLGKQTEIPRGLDIAFVHAYSDSVVAREASKWEYTFIPIDAPEITEYRVSTVQELLDAIGTAGQGSYRRIILADGNYNISDTIKLERLVSVTLEAEHPGKTEIRSTKCNVLSVNQCAGIEITGCILSNNSVQSSVKVRDLVQIQNSYDVKVKLYGQSVTTCTSTPDASLSVAMTAEEQKNFVAGLAAREGITGEGATVEITISDAQDALTEQDKNKMAQTAAEGGFQIGCYWDISMSLQAGVNTRAITHTDTPIRLVIEIPLALRQADVTFFVMRLHDGEIVLLEDLDDDLDTITIETDRFSPYTMVYKEKTGSDSVISGTLKSFGDATKGALVQLFGSTGNVIAQTTVTGSSGAYELEAVEQGSYTLTVSKAGHVTRSYAVTLEGEAPELNAEIRLKGDINGDGKVDSLDKRMIFGHIAGSTTLTGYEFQVGDVDGSGRIDALDKRMIYGHIAGTSPLW